MTHQPNPPTRVTFSPARDANPFALLGAWRAAAWDQGWDPTEIDRVTDSALGGDYRRLVRTLLDHSTPSAGGASGREPDPTAVERAIHSPALDRFQWQLFLPGGRCVLVSDDLARRAVIPGEFVRDDEPHEVPVGTIPSGVREAARAALAEAAAADVRALLAERRQIAQVWGVEDVVAVRPDLTDDQAWAVLRAVDDGQDADRGICWETLSVAAADLYGPAPDDAGAE